MKQNPIVYLIVAAAMLFVFLQIPRISQQTQKTLHYENYTDMEQDLRTGAISKLTLYGTNKAMGDFRPGAKDGNAALGSLLTALAAIGLITDTTSA